MAQKVIVPQKENYVPQFLKQRDINSYPLLYDISISLSLSPASWPGSRSRVSLYIVSGQNSLRNLWRGAGEVCGTPTWTLGIHLCYYSSMEYNHEGDSPLSLSSILGKYIKGIIIPLITLENASRGR
jgi:hypothetical protein